MFLCCGSEFQDDSDDVHRARMVVNASPNNHNNTATNASTMHNHHPQSTPPTASAVDHRHNHHYNNNNSPSDETASLLARALLTPTPSNDQYHHRSAAADNTLLSFTLIFQVVGIQMQHDSCSATFGPRRLMDRFGDNHKGVCLLMDMEEGHFMKTLENYGMGFVDSVHLVDFRAWFEECYEPAPNHAKPVFSFHEFRRFRKQVKRGRSGMTNGGGATVAPSEVASMATDWMSYAPSERVGGGGFGANVADPIQATRTNSNPYLQNNNIIYRSDSPRTVTQQQQQQQQLYTPNCGGSVASMHTATTANYAVSTAGVSTTPSSTAYGFHQQQQHHHHPHDNTARYPTPQNTRDLSRMRDESRSRASQYSAPMLTTPQEARYHSEPKVRGYRPRPEIFQ